MARIDAEVCAPGEAMPSLGLWEPQPESLTLIDLVGAVAEFATSEAEVVAVVEYLLRTRRVVLGSPLPEPELLTN